jgi:hypothetical protein
MLRRIRTLAIAVSLMAVGAIAVQQPWVKGVVQSGVKQVMYRLKSGPEAELERYKNDLETSLVQFSKARSRLEIESAAATEKAGARREEELRIEHLLACFKDAYEQGKREGFPRLVFSRSYTEEQLKSTVQQLLDSRGKLAGQKTDAPAQLKLALAQVETRIAETNRHLENMPVYEALAVAGSAVGKSDMILTTLETCVTANNRFLDSDLRDYSGVPAKAARSAIDALSAEEFLKPVEKSKEVASTTAELPSVSDLIAALEGIIDQGK